MKKLVIMMAAILSGCVVAPVPGHVHSVPVNMQVVYPVHESAYIWDPNVRLYFFWHGGHRHYMYRGWTYRHGIPR